MNSYPSSTREKTGILFVDDEDNVLRSLKRLFLDESYELFTALSGREGLDILAGRPVAVVVSDQRMPEMSGVEFLEKVKEISSDSVRIVLTGYADIQAAVQAINRGGASRYITKPWNDEELLAVVREAADKYCLVKENRYLTELTNRQNEEMKRWNAQLEIMVQEQTMDIQKQNDELKRLNEQLKRNFWNSIESFAALIEMRDRSVSSHVKNVAALSRQIASAMSLPEPEISNIVVASLLHDIGKIGIPDAILVKDEETLTTEELTEYQRHPVRGQVAVETIEGFREIGLFIRHHHEQINGYGYPDGLRKSAIPLGSRIIALADIIDRIVQQNLPHSKEGYQIALAVIEHNLDTRFDRSAFPFVQACVLEKISALEKKPSLPGGEVQMPYQKLRPGMVLTREVRSGTGILLLAQGAILDYPMIRGLVRYYEIDPPHTRIFVASGPEGSV